MFRTGSRVHSNDQRALGINGRFRSMVLDSPLPLGSEKIESQAVPFEICDPQEFGPEGHPLIVGQEAFENRVLHSLAVVET